MRQFRILPAVGLLFALALGAPGSQAASKAVNIAVTNLKAEEGVTPSMANILSDILRTELYKTGRFSVMNREDMDAILKEIKFQQSGACDQTACIVEMGQALGVDRMVAGTVGVIGDNNVISAKLINIATQKNEILVTEYFPRTGSQDPQGTFRKIALKLAGIQASVEEARPSDFSSAPKNQPKSRGLIFSAGLGKTHINLKGETFHPGWAGDGYQSYSSDGLSVGLRLGYQVHRYVAVTAKVLLYHGDVLIGENGLFPQGTPLAKLSRTNLIGTLRLLPLSGPFRPYLGLGFASVHVKVTPEAGAWDTLRETAGTMFVIQAGLEYFLIRSMGLYGEYEGYAQSNTGMNVVEGGLTLHL